MLDRNNIVFRRLNFLTLFLSNVDVMFKKLYIFNILESYISEHYMVRGHEFEANFHSILNI